MQKQLCNKVVTLLNKCMHNDATNIFNLYQEAVEEQPQMTTDRHGSKMWYLHGKLHREDGAAVEWADGTKYWYLHGRSHREDAPAVEYANGTKQWFLHGKRHREGAPAIEYADGTKEWFLHGKRHREDGAAVDWPNGTKSWYLHGVRYSGAEAWAEAVLKERNQPHDDADVDAFLRTVLSKDMEEAL
jgi:hypothetical protein